MSTHVVQEQDIVFGAPEFTELGKRLEILRIERGVSKQRLAHHAQTSRQQLWRVMTGKSELTMGLRDRLASALSIEPHTLMSGAMTTMAPINDTVAPPTPPLTMHEYLSDASHLVSTLRSMPGGDGGRRLKRALINALEDISVESGRALPLDYSEIHRRVLSGEL